MLCGETAVVWDSDTPEQAYEKCKKALCVIDMRSTPITETLEEFIRRRNKNQRNKIII